MRPTQRVAATLAFFALIAASGTCASAEEDLLGVRLVNQMNALYGQHPATRANHAKGAVFEGLFTPAQGADTFSAAAFLKGAPTPLVIRFSNAGGIPDAPDNDKSTDRVRGMAIKFRIADGSEVDMVNISVNGFPAATGEEFLALLQAAGASGPDAPKPTPIETFLSTHPAALSFVMASKPMAESYGTQPFFGVNAFKFTNAQGVSKFGRYRIIPEAAPTYISDEEAAKRAPNALADNLRASLEKGPVKFRLLVQIAADGDTVTDATKVWPDSRATVELGSIAVTKALDTAKVENELLFLPTNVINGIEPSDDPIINTRTEAYAESFGRRTK